MTWSIAEAKQRFSEVVRQAGDAPQLIHNRGTLVAAIVSPAALGELEAWQKQLDQTTLARELAELRQLLQAESIDGLPLPPRSNRANPFADALKKTDAAA